jgi:hypothetical protein
LIRATTTPRTAASGRPSSHSVNSGRGLIENMNEKATILKCSTRAIEFHRHNLRQKLGLTGNGLSLASQLARFE